MKPILTIYLLFGAFLSFAQPSPVVGDKVDYKGVVTDRQVYPIGEGVYLSVLKLAAHYFTPSVDELKCALIDRDGKVLQQGPELKSNKTTFYADVFKLGERIYLLKEEYDKTAKRYDYYLIELDRESLTQTAEQQKVFTHTEAKREFTSRPRTVATRTDVEGRFVSMLFNVGRYIEGVLMKPTSIVLDSELKQIEGLNGLAQPHFIADGSAVFFDYGLKLTYLSTSNQLDKETITTDFEILEMGKPIFDGDGFLHLAGMTGDIKDPKSQSDVFYLRYDLDNREMAFSKVTPFVLGYTLAVLNKPDRDRILASGKELVPLQDFSILNVSRTATGHTYLIAEHQLLADPILNNDVTWFEDLLVIRINDKGIVDWITTLPKKQRARSSSDYWIGGATTKAQGDNLFVFYNTEGSNLDKPERGKTAATIGAGGSALAVARITPNGELTLDHLHPEKQTGFNLDFPEETAVEVGEDLFVIFNDGKSSRYGRIEF